MDNIAIAAVKQVREKFSQAVVESVEFREEQTIVLDPAQLVEVCTYLKETCEYTFLATITAVDWLERVPRYDVIYQLLSMPRQSELRLKVRVGQRREDHPAVPTVVGIWPGANWYEREIYDMFGLTFTGHPDLRRILMPVEWTTHPLRKDYPLTGFDLPEPHWGGQVPYTVDPGVGSQTMRTSDARILNRNRSKATDGQEPGTLMVPEE
ncbi:MAG TPA: NADH-quinone oxidoreductase subunit C [Ktedonobacteraceae bacterium]|nr:NADH-quinone oxidoreductase subunit C [Ktedonobacteraceae bacterium]